MVKIVRGKDISEIVNCEIVANSACEIPPAWGESRAVDLRGMRDNATDLLVGRAIPK